ncbi:MAG: DUF4340 domain-containing protein [Phycisphaerales bacterium]|nr:DUF4340 domain-containing protein [Phycisphaerales bacterium]
MNVKTTLVLALVFALLVLGFVSLRKSTQATSTTATAPPTPQAAVTRNLLADPLGNVVKIAVKRKNGDEWTFEKKDSPEGAGGSVWFMTKPTEMKALSYEVDRIGREVGRIQYEISYREGEAGAVSAAAAGLLPSEAAVTLTDDAGKSAAVEIGHPASENETYVRLAGGDQIVVAKSNLRNLFKTKPLEYRDQQLWNFAAENATHVEIVDRLDTDGPTTYAFAKLGGRWLMDSPTPALATGKVDEMLRTICRLRVVQWEDDDRAKLPVYGLDPAALHIKVTVEEMVPVKKDAEESRPPQDEDEEAGEEKAPAAEKKTIVYQLRVSDRSPIGDDAKVYIRAGDDAAVGTVLKGTTDKFKPVMTEWRDMHITTADTTQANRIDLNLPGQTSAFVQRDGQWVFESDGAPAEQHAVVELLAAIKGLKAVAFLDNPGTDLATGFDNPQADVRLAIPSVVGVVRITVGAYSDPTTRRLVYVRRNDGAAAKVKSDDVAVLLRSVSAYRDRTIFDVQADRIRRVVLSTASKFADGRNVVTFERGDDLWSMTSPVPAPVRDDQVNKLVSSLGSLKAESVTAESGQISAFGLLDPAATAAITFETQDFELAVTEHDGKFYARRKDRETVYEVTKAFYDELFAEYRTRDVLDFEPKDVRKLSIRRGDKTQAFIRTGEKWTLEAEPDLPIDSVRLDKVLADAKELKTDRYVAHKLDDPGAFGLARPHYEFTITLAGGSNKTLMAADQTTQTQPAPMYFATVSDGSGVFLLGADAIQSVFVSLGDVEQE